MKNDKASQQLKTPGRILISAALLIPLAFAQDATSQAKFVPFTDFVQSLHGVQASEIMDQPAVKVADAMTLELMRRHLLNLYEGVNVSHSFVLGTQTVDCIPTDEQPSLRLTGLKQIAPPPKAASAPTQPSDASPFPAVSQLPEQQGSDQFGNAFGCEDGTIPMRRITLDQMAHFKNLKEFFEKGPDAGGHPYIPGKAVPAGGSAHKYAITYQAVNNWGDNTNINLWRPYIYTDIGEIFSLAQSWTIGSTSNNTQTAEVGWQNYPARVGTESSVPFIYFTADDYQKTGCYDLTCPAFVQTNKSLIFGVPFTAGSYSTAEGTQYELQFEYEFYQGNWWLSYNGTAIGYYPGSLYRGGQLTKYSNLLEFGSESVGSTPKTVWPGAGSGLWASNGWTYAAYQRQLWYISPDNSYTTYWDTLTRDQSSPACYTVNSPGYSSNWGVYFYFGGPGGTACQ